MRRPCLFFSFNSEGTRDESQTPAIRVGRQFRHFLVGQLVLGLYQLPGSVRRNFAHLPHLQRRRIHLCRTAGPLHFGLLPLRMGHAATHVPAVLLFLHSGHRIHTSHHVARNTQQPDTPTRNKASRWATAVAATESPQQIQAEVAAPGDPVRPRQPSTAT